MKNCRVKGLVGQVCREMEGCYLQESSESEDPSRVIASGVEGEAGKPTPKLQEGAFEAGHYIGCLKLGIAEEIRQKPESDS